MKMGSVQSDCKRSLQDCRDTRTKTNNHQHVLLSNNEQDDCLRFDPLQSSLLAFTINRLTSPRFQKQSLGNIANDATKVAMAFKEKGVIRGSTFYEAKLHPDSCTFESMKTIFQRQARGVGREGVFIFHFSGHGIKTRNSQFGLAPMDFDFTEETYITAHVLRQWLQDAGCKAKYVLFIINSCYAGMLTEVFAASSTELHSYPGLYVMAACTADEISVAFNTLGNSIFCYFLSHAISTSEFPTGQFPIKVIYEKCSRLSTALSSLLLGYDKTTGLISKKMHPQLMCPPQTVLEETDMVDMGLRYAAELYDSTKEIVQLDVKCQAWIEELCSDENGGLVQLRKEWILGQCIMDTILCFMLRSVARIQLTCNVTSIASANLFITTYIHTVSAISRVYEIKFNRRELFLGLQHYIDCLRHSGIRELETLKELEELLNKIQEIVNKSAMQFDEEDTDSGEPAVPRASFPPWSTTKRWEPLNLEEYLTPTEA